MGTLAAKKVSASVGTLPDRERTGYTQDRRETQVWSYNRNKKIKGPKEFPFQGTRLLHLNPKSLDTRWLIKASTSGSV